MTKSHILCLIFWPFLNVYRTFEMVVYASPCTHIIPNHISLAMISKPVSIWKIPDFLVAIRAFSLEINAKKNYNVSLSLFISKSLRHHIKIWGRGRISKSLCSRSNMLFLFVFFFRSIFINSSSKMTYGCYILYDQQMQNTKLFLLSKMFTLLLALLCLYIWWWPFIGDCKVGPFWVSVRGTKQHEWPRRILVWGLFGLMQNTRGIWPRRRL